MRMIKKPDWLKIKIPAGEQYKNVKKLKNSYQLNTVCEEARCPNICECWSKHHATFMLLGRECTRNCKFCSVVTNFQPGQVNNNEAEDISRIISDLNIKYVVLTSVTRDDLDDGGASHFFDVVKSIKKMNSDVFVEVLVPDFQGKIEALNTILKCEADVIAHNIETSQRIHLTARPMANYDLSIGLLAEFKKRAEKKVVKSSFMVGLGETDEEIRNVLIDLKKSLVDIVYIGQYLQPAKNSLPVDRYVEKEQFEYYKNYGLSIGIPVVVAGPLIRSSYMAKDAYFQAIDH